MAAVVAAAAGAHCARTGAVGSLEQPSGLRYGASWRSQVAGGIYFVDPGK